MERQRGAHEWRCDWLDPGVTGISDDPRRVPVDPGSCQKEGCLAITGGRVFDGTGIEARAGTVLTRGDRIVAVGQPEEGVPPDARRIDATGMTVLPGLIDLHTHITYHEPEDTVEQAQSSAEATLRALERLRFYLESGVTAIRDAGSHGDIPFSLKARTLGGGLISPRIFPAGRLITGTGGHGAEGLGPLSAAWGKIREASGPDDWRNAAREQFKAGADVIKIASHFSPDEVAAVVDEAHTLGLKVMCDAETRYIDMAVRAGVDVIEHPLPRSDEAIELMAQRDTQAVPTLVPYLFIFRQRGGYFGSTSRRFTFSPEANRDVVSRMIEAGVSIGVGTDLILDWFRYLPGAYIEELAELTRCGFSPAQALRAATAVSAEILDMQDHLGTLEPGKLADIILVPGRPEENLEELAGVRTVIIGGRVVLDEGRVFTVPHRPRPLPWAEGN